MTIKRRLLLILTPVILFVVIALVFFAQNKISELSIQNADETALLSLKDKAPVVFKILNDAVTDTATLGETLLTVQASGKADRELMGLLLKEFLEKNLAYQGVWVVWEPQAFDNRDSEFVGHPYSGEDGSLAMYWYQGTTGKVEVTGVNVRNETFYTIPKQTRTLTLIEPYIDPAAQPPVLMTTVTLPLIRDNKVLGVFGIDIALDKLSGLIETIRPYDVGYAMLFTSEGHVVASPKRDHVGKTLQDIVPALQKKLQEVLRFGKPVRESLMLDAADWRVVMEPVVLLPGAPAWALTAFIPEKAALAEASSALQTFLCIGLVGIAAIVGIIILGANMVGGPLGRLSAYATAVSLGDYSAQLDQSKFKDEIAVLGSAVTRMVQDLVKKIDEAVSISKQASQKSEEAAHAMELAHQAQGRAESARREGMLQAAAQLESVVQVLSSASHELAAQISQSERGATEQAARATKTFASMDAMSTTVATVAQNAGSTADAAALTRQKAEAGATVVREVVTGIEQVQRDSLTLKADMSQLSGHAQAISQIMSVISDIADQTNLLALNAAIEAARAGEAGRGFAVVADEVRKLAEKTMASTTQVGGAIKAIQDSATQSSRQVDATVQNIETTTALATRSGEALEEIVRLVDAAAGQMRFIATSSEKQSAASEEINRSLEQVNTIADETVRTMNAASRAVTELTTQSKVLSGLIRDMKQQNA